MKEQRDTTRRAFLKTTAASGIGLIVGAPGILAGGLSPNERLNLGKIGVGGKGHGDTAAISGENIVALCDVDYDYAADTIKKHPKANLYRDYRIMLEKEELDGVVITTPDHTHAPASVMAMRRGLHVYCQKPMSHTIAEARLMRNLARQYGVITQMGNQGTSNDTMRRAVELVQSGTIGQVREAHVWTNRPIWPQGLERPTGTMPVPANIDWNLWLGCAPQRPYHHEAYHPFKWRGWKDFGQGALGDMGCHNLNLAYWALELEYPTSVEAASNGMTNETWPVASKIRYEFPARGKLPPVTLYWYDGVNRPPRELLDGVPANNKLPTNGVLLVGSEGKLYAPSSHCRLYEFWPQEKFTDYAGPPQTLPRSPGHFKEWIAACKGGPPTSSDFDYAARLTETVLLGTVALEAGEKVEWDAANMRVTNVKTANQYVSKEYRKGWEFF